MKRGGIDRKSDQQRGEFRQDLQAAAHIEAPEIRNFESERKSGQYKGGERQSADEAERRPENADLRAGLRPASARPPTQEQRGDDAEERSTKNDGKPGCEERPRQEQAAIVENAAAGKRDAAAQFRQRLQHGVVPEQNLQKQRHVADQLDIAAGEPRHQPVARQPRDADDEPEHGRQHDADPGDEERVEQADPEGAAECRRAGGIADQRLADVEAGGIVPEAEAGGDMRARQILRRIEDGAVRQRGDENDEADLNRDAAETARAARHCPGFIGHGRPAAKRRAREKRLSGTAVRIAGRPWSTAR